MLALVTICGARRSPLSENTHHCQCLKAVDGRGMGPLRAENRSRDRAVDPGFGPKSRDVGGPQARRGVGCADSVRIATELSSGSAACSERRRPFSLGLEAVAALHISATHTANGTIYRAWAGGHVVLDIVKNLLGSRLPRCRQGPSSAR